MKLMLEFDLWTVIFSVINIIVLFLFVWKFLFGRVNKILEKRAAIIQDDLNSAKEKSEAAEKMKTEYEATLKDARTEAKEIVESAKQDAKHWGDELCEQARMEADATIKTAQKETARERQEMLDGVRSEIADLALTAAGKLMQQEVDDEANRKLVDAFLAEEGEDS